MAKDSKKGIWGLYRSGHVKTEEEKKFDNEKIEYRKRLRKALEKNNRCSKFPSRVIADIKRKFLNVCKGVPCMDCGISYPPYVMDFDHRDPTVKSFGLGPSPLSKTLEEIKLEVAKCDVVCANCHRIRSYERRREVRLK